MGVAILIFVFAIIPLAAGVWIALRVFSKRDLVFKIAIVLGALACGAAVFNAVAMSATAPLFDWNGAKLAPIVGMTKGFPLYDDPNTGVMSAWIYGPVPAIVFLPVALFRSPTAIIIAGVVINIVVALAPVAWIIVSGTRRNRTRAGPADDGERALRTDDWLLAFLAFATFVWVALSHESLRRCIFMIGPDGPAVALVATSCALILLRRSWLTMSFSALCAVLSVWSKQSIVPFLIVPPLFVLAVNGLRNALRYGALLAGIGLTVSAAFALSFGASNMWFHMVTLSAKQHLQDNDHGTIVALWYGVGEWSIDAAEPIAFITAVLFIRWFARPASEVRLGSATFITLAQQYVRHEPWTLLLAAGMALFPSSILGYAKIGGYYNNFALTNYFLLLAAMTALVMWWPVIRERSAAVTRFVQAALCCLLFARCMTEIGTAGALATIAERTLHPYANQQEQIVEFSKRSPGIVYFPWNNLATLLGEGKLYHFEWGIVDRYEAGMIPSAEQIAGHVPEHMIAVGFPPAFQSSNAMRLFPSYQLTTSIRELPGFIAVTDAAHNQTAQPQQQQSLPPAAQPQERTPSDFDLSPRIGG